MENYFIGTQVSCIHLQLFNFIIYILSGRQNLVQQYKNISVSYIQLHLIILNLYISIKHNSVSESPFFIYPKFKSRNPDSNHQRIIFMSVMNLFLYQFSLHSSIPEKLLQARLRVGAICTEELSFCGIYELKSRRSSH